MTYMLLLNCALKLVDEIILYYDARSKKHKKNNLPIIMGVLGKGRGLRERSRIFGTLLILKLVLLFL